MSNRIVPVVLVALSLLASAAAAQVSVLLRVDVGAPVGGAAPSIVVQPFTAPSFSLSERAAIQAMWENLSDQFSSVARECAMPVGVEIDASSFSGRLVPGTLDGLHPGTRSRFVDFSRALTAVCHRGDTERSAVQGRVRAVRFAFTDAPTDGPTLEGSTLVFRTNGDMSGSGHLGYGAMIEWIMGRL